MKQMFEIQSLGAPERALLLKALGFDKDDLYCVCCAEKTTYDKCAIMPAVVQNLCQADILCESILCMAEWIEKWNHE